MRAQILQQIEFKSPHPPTHPPLSLSPLPCALTKPRPMADHFALVPRALSARFFAAVNGFYACDGETWPPKPSWFQPECFANSFSESVLFRHLHATNIPYRLYSLFEYVITRGSQGGVCDFGASAYILACTTLGIGRAFKESFSR